MDTPGTLPLDRKVIAPLGDVLNLSVVVKPEIDHPVGDGIVGVKFVPRVTPEPSGVISIITVR
jgi:hypothetical protein